MIRARSLLAGALAILLVAGVGGQARAQSWSIPAAVTIKVDHSAKTITATVNLAFYNRSCQPGASCEPPADDVARIVKAIETMWNNGSKVKCYEFKVVVNARAVGSQSEAGQTEVDIGLDYGPVPVRAFVRGIKHGSAPPDHLSNSTDQRVEAGHDPAKPTTWPSNTYDRTYAHEFGHILGLDDNYDPNKPGFPLPGASDDLMFRKQGEVTDEMATRVVERSGQVDLKDLKCGWTHKGITPPLALGEFKGTKCDGVGGEWTVQGGWVINGPPMVTFDALTNVTIDEKTLTGSYKQESIQKAGPGLTTSNSTGRASIVMNPDGSVKMTLDPAPLTVTTTIRNLTKTVHLTSQGGSYLWLPDTSGACP